MASMVGGLIGSAIGGSFGYASIGQAIGSFVFGSLFAEDTSQNVSVEGPRLGSLDTSITSPEGNPINICYGTTRVPGKFIWASNLKETKNTSTTSTSGGKGSGGSSTQTTTTYTYSCSFAIGICEGPIKSIRTIWVDKRIYYEADETGDIKSDFDCDSFKIYYGDETQEPDPTIETFLGVGNVPAYRGLAYIVFDNLQLEKFGKRVPISFEFEVIVDGTTGPYVYTLPLADVYNWEALDMNGGLYAETMYTYESVFDDTFYFLDLDLDQKPIAPSQASTWLRISAIDPMEHLLTYQGERLLENQATYNDEENFGPYNHEQHPRIWFSFYDQVTARNFLLIQDKYPAYETSWTTVFWFYDAAADTLEYTKEFRGAHVSIVIKPAWPGTFVDYTTHYLSNYAYGWYENGLISYTVSMFGGVPTIFSEGYSGQSIVSGDSRQTNLYFDPSTYNNSVPISTYDGQLPTLPTGLTTGLKSYAFHTDAQPNFEGMSTNYGDGSYIMNMYRNDANVVSGLVRMGSNWIIYTPTAEEVAAGADPDTQVFLGSFKGLFYISRQQFYDAAINTDDVVLTVDDTLIKDLVVRFVRSDGVAFISAQEGYDEFYLMEVNWEDLSLRNCKYLVGWEIELALCEWKYSHRYDNIVLHRTGGYSGAYTTHYTPVYISDPLQKYEDTYVNARFDRDPMYDSSLRRLRVGNEGANSIFVNYNAVSAGTTTVESIASDVSNRVGISSLQRDYSNTADVEVRGLALNNRMEARKAIEPLLDSFFLDSFEDGSRIVIKKQKASTDISVNTGLVLDDKKFNINRNSLIDGVRELTLKYRSVNRDMQIATSTFSLQSYDLYNKEEITTPIVFSDLEANNLVAKTIRTRWEQFSVAKIELPKKYEVIQPGDIVEIPVESGNINFRVQEIIRNPGEKIELSGTTILDTDFIYSPSYVTYNDNTKVFYNSNIIPTLLITEIPYIESIYDYISNHSLPVILYSKEEEWEGATLFGSKTNEVFTPIDSLDRYNTPFIGRVNSIISTINTSSIIDTTSTITVRPIVNNNAVTLASLTDNEWWLQPYKNLFAVLDKNTFEFKEFFRFKIASYIPDSDDIDISHFIRGINATTHSKINQGDFLVLLDNHDSFSDYSYNYDTDIGQTHYFKTRTIGSNKFSNTKMHQIEGDSLKLLPIIDLKAIKESTNILVTWGIKALTNVSTFKYPSKDNTSGIWGFKIEIYNSDKSVILRAEEITFSSTLNLKYTYTPEKMTNDGVNQSTPLIFLIYRYELGHGYREAVEYYYSPNKAINDFIATDIEAPIFIDTIGSTTCTNLAGVNGTHRSNSNQPGLVSPSRYKQSNSTYLMAVGNNTSTVFEGVITPFAGVGDEQWTLGFYLYVPPNHSGTTTLFQVTNTTYVNSYTHWSPSVYNVVDGKIFNDSSLDIRGKLVYVLMTKQTQPVDINFQGLHVYIDNTYIKSFSGWDGTGYFLGDSFYIGQASDTPSTQSICYVGDIYVSSTYSNSTEIQKIYDIHNSIRS